MKILPLLLLVLVPASAVRFEAAGVRVGGELVTGSALTLKESILVSGSVVECLAGDSLRVALDGRDVALGTGLRLARAAEGGSTSLTPGWTISSHHTRFTLEAGGRVLAAQGSAAFKVTEKGFDFGALGALEGASFAARVAPAPPRQEISPERKLQRAESVRKLRRVFGGGDPQAGTEAADSHTIRFLAQVSPNGIP